MWPKVLIIDDSEAIHSLLLVHLQDEAIEVHSAFDGRSGLEMTGRLKPDLILLDVDMPGLDGFEVCRRLREDPFTMNVPVIFLTAAATTSQKVNGLDLGASDYILKPFEPVELLARVRASLRIKARCDTLARSRVSEFLAARS